MDIAKKLKLPLLNDYFTKYMFPDVNVISYKPNCDWEIATKVKKLIIFGDISSGKTTLARSLCKIIVDKYGVDNVNAVHSDSMEDGILYGLDSKLVQFLLFDDFTLKKADEDILKAYFRIRDIWRKQCGVTNGLIITVFNLHRFHSSLKEIRSTVDAVVVRSNTLNKYDRNVIKYLIGDTGIRDLNMLESMRDEYPELKDYSPFTSREGVVGLIKYPLQNIDYMKDVKDIMAKYPIHTRIMRKYDILY